MINSEILTEESLIEGCKRRDRKYQEILYRKYAKEMYNICLAYETDKDAAKDILQEAFIKVFRSIDQLNTYTSLKGWIRKIITNTAIDHYRKKTKENAFVRTDVFPETGDDENNFFGMDNTRDIMTLIKHLPEGARIAFNLYALEGYSHKEISKILNISEGTSKSQVSRAKQLLQERLGSFLSSER